MRRDGTSTAADRDARQGMTARAVWAIGAGQCVSWGVLYYAFGVLILPMEQELGVARWVVVGALSTALLVSAIVAPHVGALVDRGHGPRVMQAGGLVAAALLGWWAAMPSVWSSYAAWAGLGVCMAAVLYEPVFAIVGKAIAHPGDRLRAIATITVFGGLASTIFLPVTSALVLWLGWRLAVEVLAGGLAVTTLVVHRTAFSALGPTAVRRRVGQASTGAPELPGLARLTVVFTGASFVSAALSTNLIPALIDRGASPALAATLAGLFGVMQLPGRVLFMRERTTSPGPVLWSSLGLLVAGLLVLAGSRATAASVAGVALCACGSGLVTLARPFLVLTRYGAKQSGYANGVIARGQQLARAGGPVAAAALAGLIGYGWVFAALAAAVLATAAVAVDRWRPSITAARAPA